MAVHMVVDMAVGTVVDTDVRRRRGAADTASDMAADMVVGTVVDTDVRRSRGAADTADTASDMAADMVVDMVAGTVVDTDVRRSRMTADSASDMVVDTVVDMAVGTVVDTDVGRSRGAADTANKASHVAVDTRVSASRRTATFSHRLPSAPGNHYNKPLRHHRAACQLQTTQINTANRSLADKTRTYLPLHAEFSHRCKIVFTFIILVTVLTFYNFLNFFLIKTLI